MRQSLALLATLAALLVLGGQVAGDAASEGGRGLVLGLGILLLAAWISGELLAALRLPRICGYLLLGVLLGPGAAAIRPSWFPLALSAEEIASLIPTAELVIISGGAHGLHIEHATTFNRILLEFLGRAEKAYVPHGRAAREAV